MSVRVEHAAIALRIVESDTESEIGWETADAQHLANLAEAQVHATLAVVDQQRVANLIALAAVSEPRLRVFLLDEAMDFLTVDRTAGL